jgi:hypothetical protein
VTLANIVNTPICGWRIETVRPDHVSDLRQQPLKLPRSPLVQACERGYHMKPKRRILLVFVSIALKTLGKYSDAHLDKLPLLVIEPINSHPHNPASSKTDGRRSVSAIQDDYTRQGIYIANAADLDVRSATRIYRYSSRGLC